MLFLLLAACFPTGPTFVSNADIDRAIGRADFDTLCAGLTQKDADTRSYAAEKLKDLDANVKVKTEIMTEKCIVAIVGEGMKHSVGLAARTFKAVSTSKTSIQMISQGASEINITFLIDNKEIPEVVGALHSEFFPKA